MDDNLYNIDLNMIGSIDVKPVTMVKFVTKGGKLSKPMSCLIDTGASKTLVAAHVSHFGKVKKTESMRFSTDSDKITSTKQVSMKFTLPEFSESKTICPSGLRVLPEGCDLPYDLILGRDLQRELKIGYVVA